MDPDLELQGAIVQCLLADPEVIALVADRIYDRVPEMPAFPYITYGPSDSVPNGAECIDSLLVTVQIDVWSRNVGYPECKRINDAVRSALLKADLTLTVNALAYFNHAITRTFRDPDGLTNHGAVTFEAAIEKGN